jgi:hypothetical protein
VGALADDFAFVTRSVTRAARLQRAACRAVLDDETARGKALARHLELAYDAVERHVANREAKFAQALDDIERADAIVEMRRLVWSVRRLQTNLTWLNAAQQPPLDLGTRYFVEEAARALVATDVDVTVVPTDELSYATSSDPWKPLIEQWGTGVSPGERTVVVVFIPRREEESGLLHPLIVHELGHAVDSEHGIINRIWAAAQGRRRLSKRFSKVAAELAAASAMDPTDANDHLAKMLRSWITEVFCDCLAVHHLGPTYDNALPAALVVVLAHHAECEVLRVDDQRRADEITVHRVPARTPPRFDLEQDAKVLVYAIDVVADARRPLFSE